MLGCFLLVILYAPEGSWNAGQRDTFAMMVMLSSTLVMLKAIESPKHSSALLLYAGLLMSAALIIRPNNLLYVAGGLYVLWQVNRTAFVRWAGVYVGASMLLPLLFGVWYAFVPNGLHELYLATVRFNLDIYGGRVLEERAWLRTGLCAAMIGAILFFRKQHRRYGLPNTDAIHPRWYDAEAVEIYALCALITLASMRKFFAYHFTPFYPIGYLVLAIGIAGTIDRRQVPKRLFYPLFVALLLVHYYPRQVVGAFLKEAARSSWSSAYREVIDTQSQFLRDEMTMTDRMKANTRPGDTIEVCARDAGVRWRAERQLATRFTTLYPLALSDQGHFMDYQRSWREEFVKDLRAASPKYIILESTMPLGNPNLIQVFTPGFRDLETNLPALGALLRERYQLDTVLTTYTSYKRRE
jgi:hypothetical protein